MTELNVITESLDGYFMLAYVNEISLTSTSSKDHLLNNFTEPSPTMSAGRIAALWEMGSSPAVQSDTLFHSNVDRGRGKGRYRRT
jgi:hypothetical protein